MKKATGRRLPALANLLAMEATVRLGSLTEAGNELCLTQSTISKQLSELEAFVGVRLLSRAKGAVAATPAGAQYLLRLRKAIAEIEDATLEVQSGQGRGGRLNLSVPVSLGNIWLMPRLLQFAKQQPSIQLNLSTKIGPVDLRSSGADAAIMYCDGPGPGQYGLLIMPLELIAVCAPELVQPAGTLQDTLIRLPLLHQVAVLEAWPAFFSIVGLKAPRAFKGPRYSLLTMGLQAALNGIGVALLPLYVAGDDLRAGRLVRLSDKCYVAHKAYYFVCPDEAIDTPAISAFLHWMRDQIGASRSGPHANASSPHH